MNFFNVQIKTIILLINTLLLLIILFFNIQIKDNKQKSEPLIEQENIEKEVKEEEKNNKIKIDIKGAINNPGVYEVDNNAIINDLINIAGGLTENAETKNINLSKRLKDEMVIYIYTNEELSNINSTKEEICYSEPIIINKCIEEKQSIIMPNNGSENASKDNKISINSGTKEELMSISGIGEVKAISIINYREQNGLFKNLEELKNVNGISANLYDKIKDYLKL